MQCPCKWHWTTTDHIKLPYWLQSGFTCSQGTVNWQSSLSSSVGQWLHACQTALVIKAAFLTKATSENWNRQTRLQPSCSNYLEWPTARLTLRCYIRTIPICDKETFLRTGFHELIMWLSRSHDSFLPPTTYGALSNTYNNNNNILSSSIIFWLHCPCLSFTLLRKTAPNTIT